MGLHNCSIRELSESLKSIPHFGGLGPASMLRSLPFFADVADSVLEEIAGSVVVSEFPRDAIVCRHGKFDERFYIILSGEVRAVIPTEQNPRFELFRLGRGDFFGEEIILSLEPRQNTIVAVSDIMTLSMGADILKKLVDSSDNIRSLMDRLYIERDLKGDLRRIPLLTNLSEELFTRVLEEVELLSMPAGMF